MQHQSGEWACPAEYALRWANNCRLHPMADSVFCCAVKLAEFICDQEMGNLREKTSLLSQISDIFK